MARVAPKKKKKCYPETVVPFYETVCAVEARPAQTAAQAPWLF